MTSASHPLTLALLANPDSGSGEAEDVAATLRAMGPGVSEYTLDQVDEAVASGPDRIAVAGGDGSLAPVAAALAKGGGPELAVIPTGTANDFARALGLPSDTDEACALAASGAHTRTLDLAWMGERPFLNVASLGLPPAAARRATGLKRALGPLAYAVGAIGAGIRSRPVACRVTCDRELVFEGEAWQVTVACSGAFGGGASVDAEPDDGRLDVIVIEAGSRMRLALHGHALRSGGIADQEGILKRSCGAARIEFEGDRDMNVDGEVIRHAGPEFRLERRAFSVVVPS